MAMGVFFMGGGGLVHAKHQQCQLPRAPRTFEHDVTLIGSPVETRLEKESARGSLQSQRQTVERRSNDSMSIAIRSVLFFALLNFQL
jgi:hypothetical protein